MLQIFKYRMYLLARLEKNSPRIFWGCIALLGFLIFYQAESQKIYSQSESDIIIEHFRGGSKSDMNSNLVQPPTSTAMVLPTRGLASGSQSRSITNAQKLHKQKIF
jgi:hypothetical protein